MNRSHKRTVSDASRPAKVLKTRVASGKKSLKNKGIRIGGEVVHLPIAPAHPQEGEFLKRIKIGALNTPDQWLRQIGKMYRLARRGMLSRSEARLCAPFLKMGIEGAKQVADSKELQTIRQRLEEVGVLRPDQNIAVLPALEHDLGDDPQEPV